LDSPKIRSIKSQVFHFSLVMTAFPPVAPAEAQRTSIPVGT
jgi:hypothetical protein